MLVSELKTLVLKLEQAQLPGIEAHFRMAPQTRARMGKVLDYEKLQPKKSAVLCLLFPNAQNELQVTFILRNTYKGVHSNQIGFPGGKVAQTDTSYLETALRETYEEVGVDSHAIHVLKELTLTYIPPSNFIVQPFLGYCAQTPQFDLCEKEVADLITIPLKELLMDSAIGTTLITNSYTNNVSVPAFIHGETVIWGATAMILSEIIELLLFVSK